jgi:hypothetical protein
MNIAWSHDLDEVFGAHNPSQQPLPRPLLAIRQVSASVEYSSGTG